MVSVVSDCPAGQIEWVRASVRKDNVLIVEVLTVSPLSVGVDLCDSKRTDVLACLRVGSRIGLIWLVSSVDRASSLTADPLTLGNTTGCPRFDGIPIANAERIGRCVLLRLNRDGLPITHQYDIPMGGGPVRWN